MKKVIYLIAGILAVVSCKDSKMESAMTMNDSLQHVLSLRDAEIDNMMSMFNEVQEGFKEINAAEGRVAVANAGEGENKEAAMKENILFIKDKMQKNRELIAKLQKQLNQSNFKGKEMQRSIENLVAELEAKTKQLEELQEQLKQKDIKIAELDKTVSDLNTNVDELKAANSESAARISSQEAELNTAYYAFGTKAELKSRGVIKGKVILGGFDKNYFTKIDVRNTKEFKLNSKSAVVLSPHPLGSYVLEKDANSQYVLRITNVEKFWSVTRYLIVKVK